jgi:hypothetical protein
MSSAQQTIFSLIGSMAGQKNIVAIPRIFIHITGDHYTALLLSQLLFWSDKGKNPQWFYKSDKEIREELVFTDYRIRKARAALIELKLIETKLKRAEGAPTTHYKLNRDKLVQLITRFVDGQQIESLTVDKSELSTVNETITETTQETTTLSLADKPQGAPPAEDEPQCETCGGTGEVFWDDADALVMKRAPCPDCGNPTDDEAIQYYRATAGEPMTMDEVMAGLGLPPFPEESLEAALVDAAIDAQSSAGKSLKDAVSNLPTPPAKKEKAPRPRDPVFDAIAETLFNADLTDKAAVEAIGGRVGKVRKKLKGLDVTLAEFTKAVKWYRRENADISMPRDPEKAASMIIDYRASLCQNGSGDRMVMVGGKKITTAEANALAGVSL